MELVVEGDDLRPVGGSRGGGVGVDGGDGGLDLERAGLVAAQAGPHQRVALGDELAVPRERSWSARRTIEPSGATRAGRRASVSSMSASRPTASGSSGISSTSTRPRRIASAERSTRTRLVAGCRGVALGEDQGDGGEHRVQAVGQLGGAGDAVGGVVVAELALGPHDALGHGRLGDQEGPGDLGHLEPAEQPQGQRHLGVGAEGGVAAQEHQPELVVGDDVDEVVEVVEVGVGVVGFHGRRVQSVGGEVAVGRGWPPGGAGRWPGCGRSW